MQTADFDVHSFEQSAQSEEDKKLLVKFFTKPKQDQQETLAQGRPVFKDVEYVDIKIPGDRSGGACRPATYQDKQRFAQHYSMFKQRVEAPVEGTPLAEWPLVTRSQVEEFAFHNIKTVEHLASMSDANAQNFMGVNVLKAKAVKWLENAGEEAKVHELTEKLAERDERIDRLEEQVKQMLEANTATIISTPVDIAPSLASDLDNVAVGDEPAPKTRRRRVKKADATVQINK